VTLGTKGCIAKFAFGFISAPDKQLSAEQSPPDKMKRFRPRLTAGMFVLAVSMIDWLVALVWITYLLIVGLVS
jgi:hypothetical protein